MRFFTNDFGNPDAYYEPNTKGGAVEVPEYEEPPMQVSGEIKRYEDQDQLGDFKQPGDLFRMFNDAQKNRLFNNIAAAMQGVSDEIIERQLELFKKADPNYAAGVKKALQAANTTQEK